MHAFLYLSMNTCVLCICVFSCIYMYLCVYIHQPKIARVSWYKYTNIYIYVFVSVSICEWLCLFSSCALFLSFSLSVYLSVCTQTQLNITDRILCLLGCHDHRLRLCLTKLTHILWSN